jgi:hypothetical protein
LGPVFFLQSPDFLTPCGHSILRETRRESLRERDFLSIFYYTQDK